MIKLTKYQTPEQKLGYAQIGARAWTYFVSEKIDFWEWHQVGPVFETKRELLAMADEYARGWGGFNLESRCLRCGYALESTKEMSVVGLCHTCEIHAEEDGIEPDDMREWATNPGRFSRA
jgi:hypothetical protein